MYNRLTLEITLFVLAFAGPLVWLINGFIDVYNNTYHLSYINIVPLIILAAALLGTFITSYVKLNDRLATFLIYAGVSLPVALHLIFVKIGIISNLVAFTILYSLGTYLILASLLALVENIDRLIPCEERGKLGAVFLLITMVGVFVKLFLQSISMPIVIDGISLIDVGILIVLALSLLLKPWNFERHNYTVHGSIKRYQLSWFFIGLSVITWYIHSHNAKVMVQLSHHGFIPLGDIPLIAAPIIGIGAFISGILADRIGRRQSSTISVLLIAGLSIYTPSLSGDTTLISLLSIIQDFIFGYVLLIGMFLIWGEIGSYTKKAKRIFVSWAYMFIIVSVAIYVHVNEIVFPLTLANFSLSLSITFALIAFYPLAQAPEVLENEVEIEKLEINLDYGAIQTAVDDIMQEKSIATVDNSKDSSGENIETKSSRKIKRKKKSTKRSEKPEKKVSVGEYPVSKIKGIGTVTSERLKRLGYTTIHALSMADPEELAIQLHISIKRARNIIEAAEKMIEEDM